MKKIAFFCLLCLSCQSSAQVVIRSADMFSEVGLYYRAYANSQNALLPQTFLIREKVGESGGPHLWDFSEGPTGEIWRIDYINPHGTIVGVNFPETSIAEKKTWESNGRVEYLLLNQIPLIGRRVYGFFQTSWLDEIAVVFEQPIVDFPDPMQYGDTWSTSISFTSTFSLVGVEFPVRVTQVSQFEVDAFGFIELPNLGFGDVLRVNELVTQTEAVESNNLTGTGDAELDDELGVDGGTSFQDIQKTYHRNLYFIRPGLGIVAQITTKGYEADPGPNFQEAIYFMRMFETNKRPPEACETPESVSDLSISFSGGRALLKWSAAECTDSYRVEYSNAGGQSGSWQLVGETQNTFMVDVSAGIDPARIYRVISQKANPTNQ